MDNVVGFSVFGDYRKPSPPLDLVRAVQQGTIDVAIAWGPSAGYVAKHSSRALTLSPVLPAKDGPYPFVYEISMGVRHGNDVLTRQLDQVLAQNRGRIERLLHDFGVPLF